MQWQAKASISLMLISSCLYFSSAASAMDSQFSYNYISTYDEICGDADEDDGCAEISAFDPINNQVFTTNGTENILRVLSMDSSGVLSESGEIDLSPYGGAPNSVAVSGNLVAVAVQAPESTDSGHVVVFDTGSLVESLVFEAGALPDMLTFTPDGRYLIVANEGEPNDEYSVDPEGTVTIISTADGSVRTADFAAFNGSVPSGVRVFGPAATVAQDLEPEYIAVSPDSKTAWVSLQENNALATGDTDGDGDIDQIYSYGARSFSIWDWSGNLVYDSGNEFETRLAQMQAAGEDVWVDSRSDDKGPEPESITLASVLGKTYALIGLERVSGVFVYDITDPFAPAYTGYVNTKAAGDISPEGLIFVSNGSDGGVLIVTNEISNTTSTYQLSFGSGDVASGNVTEITAADGEILLPAGPYWQVQSEDGLTNICEGNITQCSTGTGSFIVIDLIDQIRVDGFIVGVVVRDNTISWPGDDFWQVQTAGTFEPICEGREPCEVSAGTYNVINLTTGQRFENIEVGSGSSGNNSNVDDMESVFSMQLLHAADMDGVAGALDNVSHFSALVDYFRASHANTVVLSSGDNYIPGPRFLAAEDDSLSTLLGIPAAGRADIALLNAMRFQASAVGNHELDTGTAGFASIFATETADDGSIYAGAQFPYLSSNLDFTADEDLAGFVGSDGSAASSLSGQLAAYTTIDVNGETIGVVGATTPSLASITSTGAIGIAPTDSTDIDALAVSIQTSVDALEAIGVNKIILLGHMQQISIERELAAKLSGVDIIIAGGSNTLLADDNDVLRAGDTVAGTYPEQLSSADDEPVLLVNTDGDYKYLGRMVVEFNSAGQILLDRLNEDVNGAWAATSEVANQLGAVPNQTVVVIANALNAVLAERDGNILGKTSVYLDGRRNQVRTEETNMGNLTAEANLWLAQQVDSNVAVSLKNGGGIRADIGLIVQPPGSTDPSEVVFLPPAGNPTVGKETGDISQFDIQQVLRFNNGLVLLSATAAEFVDIMEHAVAATEEGATPGSFPQVAGMRFTFDPSATARDGSDVNGSATTPGQRIQSLDIVDSTGQVVDTLVSGGLLQGDANRIFRFVTLDFLAKCVGVENEECGDGYPLNGLSAADLSVLEDIAVDPGMSSFADLGSEQDALAEYLQSNFATTPFDEAETSASNDTRIINLQAQ